jgi:hypothetical protein
MADAKEWAESLNQLADLIHVLRQLSTDLAALLKDKGEV